MLDNLLPPQRLILECLANGNTPDAIITTLKITPQFYNATLKEAVRRTATFNVDELLSHFKATRDAEYHTNPPMLRLPRV
jgi:hypothetical protein